MALYTCIRKYFSDKNKGILSQIIFYLGLKPKINKKLESAFSLGSVIFSADFEMSWAFRYSKMKSDRATAMGLQERENFPKLFGLFEKYRIPVTWATVGHLFLENCRKNGRKPHSNLPRPEYFENRNWLFDKGDWYEHDPCSDLTKAPAWYAADLINQIIHSKTNHEIGCHTFSHLDFTYKNCPKELADAELDECIKLAKEKEVELKTMVFPGGTLGNFESLKERGFICYRKPLNNHLDLPYIDKFGLVAIPSSLGLDRDPYGWSKEFHLKMIRKFLKKTIKHKQVCHFWFHPSMDPWYLENVMPEILKLVNDYRNSKKIRVLTMGELAKEVLS